ncbi:flagellin [Lachnospiraceae bacterium NLAE-zl-G231]|nr:flagellin [Lachnospiraceae bacterium NLAE-zl-G231]
MRIQHNIAALNSYRNLSGNNNAVSKNLEKLSSGYRINRAGDDAAGLAISEKMRAQITGLKTAQKNANDGISLVQTAEGALTEVHSMLNRMVELADQSANGTYDNKVDRANLQKELDSLKSEIDRISEGTNFNGINLLDGSLSGTGAGGGLTGAQVVTYKAATATVDAATLATDTTAGNVDWSKTDKVIVDGTEIEVDWTVLDADDRALLSKDWATADAADTKKAAEIIQKTVNDAIEKYNTQYGASVSSITVKADGAGKFVITSGQADGNSNVTIKDSAGDTSFLSVLTDAEGNADVATNAPVSALKNAAGDYNGSFTMTIDGEEIAITTAGVANPGNIASSLQTAINNALANYDTAKGTTGTDEALNGKVTVKLNANGQLEFNNTTGKKIGFEDKDGGNIAATLGISTEGKNSMNGGLTLQIGDTAADFNQLTVSVGDMSSSSLGIGGISIATQSGAKAAVDKIKSAINSVSSTRGDLGAIQNRLEHTINNLGVTTENMTAAESRIRDVDMADEMMSYTKNNILVQASQAMLAQANQLPQGVLQLLQ